MKSALKGESSRQFEPEVNQMRRLSVIIFLAALVAASTAGASPNYKSDFSFGFQRLNLKQFKVTVTFDSNGSSKWSGYTFSISGPNLTSKLSYALKYQADSGLKLYSSGWEKSALGMPKLFVVKLVGGAVHNGVSHSVILTIDHPPAQTHLCVISSASSLLGGPFGASKCY